MLRQPTGMELLQYTLSSQGSYIFADQFCYPILSEVYDWVHQRKQPYLRHAKGKIQRKLWWQFPKLLLCNALLCRKAHIEPWKPVAYHRDNEHSSWHILLWSLQHRSHIQESRNYVLLVKHEVGHSELLWYVSYMWSFQKTCNTPQSSLAIYTSRKTIPVCVHRYYWASTHLTWT